MCIHPCEPPLAADFSENARHRAKTISPNIYAYYDRRARCLRSKSALNAFQKVNGLWQRVVTSDL